MEVRSMKSAQQMAQNYSQAMSSPTTSANYKQGIASTSVNPMALAATPEAEARYIQGVQQSVASGKRANKLNSVSVQTWKDNATNVGAQRLSTGAQKAASKVQAHFQKWAPIYQQASDVVKSMPKGGIANAQARVAAALQVLMGAAGTA